MPTASTSATSRGTATSSRVTHGHRGGWGPVTESLRESVEALGPWWGFGGSGRLSRDPSQLECGEARTG